MQVSRLRPISVTAIRYGRAHPVGVEADLFLDGWRRLGRPLIGPAAGDRERRERREQQTVKHLAHKARPTATPRRAPRQAPPAATDGPPRAARSARVEKEHSMLDRVSSRSSSVTPATTTSACPRRRHGTREQPRVLSTPGTRRSNRVGARAARRCVGVPAVEDRMQGRYHGDQRARLSTRFRRWLPPRRDVYRAAALATLSPRAEL